MDIRKVRDGLRGGGSIYTLPLRVTFYARVSTEKYEQASSLEHQIDYYTDYISQNEHWTYVEGYIDDGISGTTTTKRDSFNRMIADAKRGLFDLIITKEISRFSRNTLDSIQFTQELLGLGVGVFFQNDNINTLDTDSEFRLVVMAGVAQDEVRKLSERLKFGFHQSIKNGRVLGNSRMYGYDKDHCQMAINEEEAEIVRLIFDLYVNWHMGLRRISHHLYDQYGYTSARGNAFNVTTIKNILQNPKYKGYYCGNKTKNIDYRTKQRVFLDQSEWVMYQDAAIPAIVSEELWDAANALLDARRRTLGTQGAEFHNRYPYSGKILCGQHHTSFHRAALRSRKGEQEVWQCKVYRQRGRASCKAPQLRSRELDEILAGIFPDVTGPKERFIEAVLGLLKSAQDTCDYTAQLSKIQWEMDGIRAKKDRLLELSIEELVSDEEFKVRNEGFNSQLSRCMDRENHLKNEQRKSVPSQDSLDWIRQTLEKLLSFQGEISSRLAACILDHVLVYEGEHPKHTSLEVHTRTGDVISIVLPPKK